MFLNWLFPPIILYLLVFLYGSILLYFFEHRPKDLVVYQTNQPIFPISSSPFVLYKYDFLVSCVLYLLLPGKKSLFIIGAPLSFLTSLLNTPVSFFRKYVLY